MCLSTRTLESKTVQFKALTRAISFVKNADNFFFFAGVT